MPTESALARERASLNGDVFLDQAAEAFAVFVFHVDKFDAVTVGGDIADDSGEMNFAEAGTNFELDGIAGAEAMRCFNEGATEADGFDASHGHLRAVDLGAQRRVERDARIAARHYKIAERRSSGLIGSADACGTRAFFHESEGVFGGGAETTGFSEGESFTLAGELAEQLDGFGGAKAAEAFDGFDADELVAKSFVFTSGNFHKQGNGSGFLADANLVDHHGDDERMRVLKNGGENEGGALGGRRVGRAGKFADGEILKVPFPAGKSSREAAEQTIGVGGGEHFDGGADALATGFEEASLEKSKNGDADGPQQTSHGRHHVGGTRLGKKQRKAIKETLGIALQETRERRIESAIGEGGVDDEHPTIVGDETVAEGGEMFVLGIAGKFFEGDKNVFEAGEIVAGNGSAAEGFEEGGKHCGSFGRLVFGEGGKRELGEFLGKLIGPETFEQGRELAKTRGDDTARGGVGVVEAARVVEKDSAGFSTGSVGAGVD